MAASLTHTAHAAIPVLARLVIGLFVFLVLVQALRWGLTRRTLNSRRSFGLRPTESFDPSEDQVEGFGRQLTQVLGLMPWWTRRATAIRITYSSAPGGRMHTSIEVAEASVNALKAALSTYSPEVQVRDE